VNKDVLDNDFLLPHAAMRLSTKATSVFQMVWQSHAGRSDLKCHRIKLECADKALAK
jgi:hypothetical protein